jgi:hypothetical protein
MAHRAATHYQGNEIFSVPIQRGSYEGRRVMRKPMRDLLIEGKARSELNVPDVEFAIDALHGDGLPHRFSEIV